MNKQSKQYLFFGVTIAAVVFFIPFNICAACGGTYKCYDTGHIGCESTFTTLACSCADWNCSHDPSCCAWGGPGCTGSCSGGPCTSCSTSSVGSCQGKDPGDSCNGGTCVDDGGTGGDGCPTCDCDTGGGAAPSVTPTPIVVNCSVSGPAKVMQGAPVLYNAGMSNATELDLSYKAVDGSPNWTVIFDNMPANTAGTFTCPSACLHPPVRSDIPIKTTLPAVSTSTGRESATVLFNNNLADAHRRGANVLC